jgi:cytochrome P450
MLSSPSIPGPSGQGLKHMRAFHRRPLAFFRALTQQYGPLVQFNIGTWRFVLAASEDAVKAILTRHGTDFEKGPGLKSDNPLIGSGLLTLDGPAWVSERRRLAPVFVANNVEAMRADMAGWAQNWVAELPSQQLFDVHQSLLQGVLDLVIRTLFAESRPQDLARLHNDIQWIMAHFYHRLRSPWRFGYHWPWPFNRRYHLRAERLKTTVSNWQPVAKPYRRLADVLAINQPADLPEALTLLIAGHETTANALAWTLFLLSRHPAWDDAVYAESQRGDEPTLTRALIQESLRLFPPVWLISRAARHATQVSGYEVPAGRFFLLSPWLSHRNPEVFAQPDQFQPTRWTDPTRPVSPYAYFPFGAGPRACIGQRLAWFEMTLVIQALVRRYRVAPGPDPVPFAGMTLTPQHGLWITLIPR